MIRQILVAQTVAGASVILKVATDVAGINEIREILKKAGTDGCYEIEEGEVSHLEQWGRDSGVGHVQRLKTQEQISELEKAKAARQKDRLAEATGKTESEPEKAPVPTPAKIDPSKVKYAKDEAEPESKPEVEPEAESKPEKPVRKNARKSARKKSS